MSRHLLAEYVVPPNASIYPDGDLALATHQFNANADVLQHADGSRTVIWWLEGGRRLAGDGRVTFESAPEGVEYEIGNAVHRGLDALAHESLKGVRLPYVVSDSHGVPAGGQIPILAAFSTEELAARFIELLPDHETGRYSLCGPSDDYDWDAEPQA